MIAVFCHLASQRHGLKFSASGNRRQCGVGRSFLSQSVQNFWPRTWRSAYFRQIYFYCSLCQFSEVWWYCKQSFGRCTVLYERVCGHREIVGDSKVFAYLCVVAVSPDLVMGLQFSRHSIVLTVPLCINVFANTWAGFFAYCKYLPDRKVVWHRFACAR